MPMNPRLLRPRASGSVHPDALAWRTAVNANGGTVSASTLAAVSAFCRSIDLAGLRGRFYRLNLFCGTGLSACLVPLYRGPSRTGTQFGNTTDTNFNFVAGDYTETGSTAGLKGDGSTKYLNTGFKAPGASASPDNFHIGAYAQGVEANGTSRIVMGMLTNTAGTNRATHIGWTSTGSVASAAVNEPTVANAGGTDRQGLLMAVTSGSRVTTYYDDSVSVATGPGTDIGAFETGSGDDLTIFARNTASGPAFFSLDKRVRGYSVGLGMTAAQVLSYYNAMQTFQTALSRNV